MNDREVYLFLKYPGSKRALDRLQHSYLECIVEHKFGTLEELLSYPPDCLKSDYQLKSTIATEDDNLVITFVPKQIGLHTVRIFVDTQEHCKPVAFTLNQNLEAESLVDNTIKTFTTFVHQVKPASSPTFFKSLPKQSTNEAMNPHQNMMNRPSSTVKDNMITRISGVHQMSTGFQIHQQQQNPQKQHQQQQHLQQQHQQHLHEQHQQQQHLQEQHQQQHLQEQHKQQQQIQQLQLQSACPLFDDNFIQDFTSKLSSNLSLSQQCQGFPSSHKADPPPGISHQPRFSHITSQVGSYPMSQVTEELAFASINSMALHTSTFSELHSRKKVGETLGNIQKKFLSLDYNQQVTQETFNHLRNDIKFFLGYKGLKTKGRCDMCSKKKKVSKMIVIGQHDFCEKCFKRQYILRTAIDHFMVPCIQECSADVPINKKGTKHITTRMTIVDINLRGLEPNEVKFAQEEFKRFDMDRSGWIVKALVLPLLWAYSSACLSDQEIRHLLTSQSLKSLMTSYGLDDRVEVHELEFLGLLAFVAREAVSLHGVISAKDGNKFSPIDLDMAYAFHNQFGSNSYKHPLPQRQTDISPSHLSNVGSCPSSTRHDSHPLNVYPQLNALPKHHSAMMGHPVQLQCKSLAGEIGGVMTGQDSIPVKPGDGKQWMFKKEQDKIYPSDSTLRQNLDMGQVIMSDTQRQPGQDNVMKQNLTTQQLVREGSPMTIQVSSDFSTRPLSTLQLRSPILSGDILIKKDMQVAQERKWKGVGLSTAVSHSGIYTNTQLFESHGQQLHALEGGKEDQLSTREKLPPLLGDSDGDILKHYLPEKEELVVKLSTIPPGKDPAHQTITFKKKNSSSKKIMHDLKLTGDLADSWMLY